jgi:DamX protein
MANNDLFSAASNHGTFDDEGLEFLPLLTKERTQKFELLLHLIPNLKQHLIVGGASGIGKTFLLDMLYDLNSEAWQCCFVQGSAELSFETIEAQLTKTLLRNKHVSLESALHNFQEQHKKIVLIIDDAGLLVSGLMTTLIEYATAQPALKLIFSLTPEARQNHRKTDKALDSCYLLEIPTLSKRQCTNFLRHLAAKPRTYGALLIDEKLLEKIYRDTQGIPARIINDFTKLSRENQNDYSKWLIVFAGVIILAIAINQGVRYLKKESLKNDIPILPLETVEKIEKTPVATSEKTPSASSESQLKTDEDIIIPEFKLDIEKGGVSSPTAENPPVEKSVESNPAPVVESEKNTEPEKVVVPIETTSEPKTIAPIVEVSPVSVKSEPEKTAPQIEKSLEPAPILQPEIVAPPVVIEPEKLSVSPVISFPKIEPAKGMKIQALPEKAAIETLPIAVPEVKKVDMKAVEKVEIKPVEKPVEIKKPEPPKVEPVKKVEPKSVKEKAEKADKSEKEKAETIVPPAAGRYALQLITLSSEAAVEAFQKKHPTLNKNSRVVKSGTEEQPRFALMYGGFTNADEATKSRENLPSEFAGALPRKLNP